MAGNGMARLRQAVGPAAEDAVLAAANSWYEGAAQIYRVVTLLDQASPVIAEQLGPKSGPAAARAFAKMSERLEVRRQQMDDAGTALVGAQQTIVAARETLQRLESQAPTDPGSFTPDPGRDDVENLKAMRAHHAQVSAYQADLAAQDAEANRAADEMDRTFTDSSATMKKIHGEPDRPAGGGGGGSTPGGSTPPGGGGRAPAGYPGDPGDRGPGTGGGGGGGGGGRGDGPAGELDLPTDGSDDTPSTSIGVPQGPTATPGTIGNPTATPGGAVPTAAPGGATLGGVAGAIGGGVIGGATGIAGAVRGGSVPVAATSSGSGSAPRAIGSTTRTGTSGPLGRTASPAAGATSPGARATSGGATGARPGSAGSPARGAGAPGSRGGAGGRGAGGAGRAAAGAGAAGRAASRRDEEKKGRQEFYEDTQDWVDDEDAAPGVID